MTAKRNSHLWVGLILAGWATLLGFSTTHNALPAAWWYAPGEVEVEDARRGVCPVVVFDREIRRPFQADWSAALLRRQANGGYATVATFNGGGPYRPDAVLPAVVDLAWWFDIPPDACTWRPGQYRVHTEWTIYPDAGGQRVVRRTSPTFEITAD